MRTLAALSLIVVIYLYAGAADHTYQEQPPAARREIAADFLRSYGFSEERIAQILKP